MKFNVRQNEFDRNKQTIKSGMLWFVPTAAGCCDMLTLFETKT